MSTRAIRTLAVEKLGPELPSRFNEYPYRIAVFKDIDTNEHVKLNLNIKPGSMTNVNNWLNLLKKGNLLDCTMMDGKYAKLVNQWVMPRIRKLA